MSLWDRRNTWSKALDVIKQELAPSRVQTKARGLECKGGGEVPGAAASSLGRAVSGWNATGTEAERCHDLTDIVSRLRWKRDSEQSSSHPGEWCGDRVRS